MPGKCVGFVSKPIKCPCCDVVTAVPWGGEMWLTDDAAGWAPHGYRCRAHAREVDVFGVSVPDVMPQPDNAPRRLPKSAKGVAA